MRFNEPNEPNEQNGYMQLFRDRNLNIAILISTSWHIVCMFSITPILVSNNINKNTATISFLGSILERVTAVQERPFSLDRVSMAQVVEKARGISSKKFSLTQPEADLKVLSRNPDKEKIIFSENKYKEEILKGHHKIKGKPRIRFRDALVTGEAMNRKVLYKPELAKVFVFPSSFSSDYNVSIRFKISRYGFVKNPECIVSSGSFDIDQIAIRYIRRWQFVPQDKDGQEGVIRINLQTEL